MDEEEPKYWPDDVPPCQWAEMLELLSPETRRRFLKQIAGAGVVFAIGPKVTAWAQTAPDSTKPTAAPPPVQTADVRMKINGRDVSVSVDTRRSLLDLLREQLRLTGSKKGCDHGQCGACTVLVNGRRINSCLSLAVVHDGDEITTIEGLAKGDQLHPVQAAFVEHDGFQCGYCTPGQICSAVACINEGHTKSDDEIREWMSGNLCRCGAYPNIVDAIKEAAGRSA
jgi:xanthine dehydrogenase YagT iron-sulfur-binding subunit